jgi:hypothetical protein
MLQKLAVLDARMDLVEAGVEGRGSTPSPSMPDLGLEREALTLAPSASARERGDIEAAARVEGPPVDRRLERVEAELSLAQRELREFVSRFDDLENAAEEGEEGSAQSPLSDSRLHPQGFDPVELPWEQTDEGATRYWAKTTTGHTLASGEGSYATADIHTTADASDDPIKSGVKLWLPRFGSWEDPNVASGAVLPTRKGNTENDDDWYCIVRTVDGKVDVTVRPHLDMTDVPSGWTALADAKGRLIVGWNDDNLPTATTPGKVGGDVANFAAWAPTTSAPSATDAAQIDTSPSPPQTVATEDHTHTVSLHPNWYAMGFIYRSS